MHGKIAASVLLKLFISGNESCHTTDARIAREWNSIFKCKQHIIHNPRGSENYFLHMGQGFPHQLPVLENVILHPPCKTSRVR